MDLFDIAVASKLAGGGGGGGGASNVVQGEFKTEGNWLQTVELPDTGSGFPVAALIWIKGGVDDASSGTPNFNRVNGDNNLIWGMIKCNTTAPSWSSSDNDKSSVFVIYKYGNTTTQVTHNKSYNLFKTSDPSTGGSVETVSWIENNKFKLCQTTGSGKYFLRGIEYQYIAIYSS